MFVSDGWVEWVGVADSDLYAITNIVFGSNISS